MLIREYQENSNSHFFTSHPDWLGGEFSWERFFEKNTDESQKFLNFYSDLFEIDRKRGILIEFDAQFFQLKNDEDFQNFVKTYEAKLEGETDPANKRIKEVAEKILNRKSDNALLNKKIVQLIPFLTQRLAAPHESKLQENLKLDSICSHQQRFQLSDDLKTLSMHVYYYLLDVNQCDDHRTISLDKHYVEGILADYFSVDIESATVKVEREVFYKLLPDYVHVFTKEKDDSEDDLSPQGEK